VLLEDWPSGVKFVFVDDDWGSGRQNDGLVAPEESRLALDANSAHEFILDTRTVFKRESWGNRLRYSNVKRNILTLQHAVFFARLEEIDGTLADKVVVRIWRGTREGLNLSKFDANVLSLNALRAQTDLDGLIEERRAERGRQDDTRRN